MILKAKYNPSNLPFTTLLFFLNSHTRKTCTGISSLRPGWRLCQLSGRDMWRHLRKSALFRETFRRSWTDTRGVWPEPMKCVVHEHIQLFLIAPCAVLTIHPESVINRGRAVSNVFELVAQPHFHVYELGNKICLNCKLRVMITTVLLVCLNCV